MKQIYLFGVDGRCFSRLSGPREEMWKEYAERNGATNFAVIDDVHNICDVQYRDGQMVFDPAPVRELTYQENRLNKYPPIGNQIDALWHAMQRGELPMVKEFYDPIAAIKEAYPREAGG